MRLIDADALMTRHLPNHIGDEDENESRVFNYNYGYSTCVSDIRKLIENEITVDAIPTTTLHEWLDNACEQDDIPMIHALDRILKRWERTNGKK